MNSFSVYLILIDLLYSLKPFLIITNMVGVALLFGLCCASRSAMSTTKPVSFNWLFIPLFLLLVGLAIPSYKTLLMVGASEYGEHVVNSEAGQMIIQELKERLRDVTSDK